MKTTFKMSIIALSLGLMTVVSSCGEKKSTDVSTTVDSNKTVIEPTVDSTSMAPMDTSSSTTSSKTTTTTTTK